MRISSQTRGHKGPLESLQTDLLPERPSALLPRLRSEVRLAPVSTAPTRMAQVSKENDGKRESLSQQIELYPAPAILCPCQCQAGGLYETGDHDRKMHKSKHVESCPDICQMQDSVKKSGRHI